VVASGGAGARLPAGYTTPPPLPRVADHACVVWDCRPCLHAMCVGLVATDRLTVPGRVAWVGFRVVKVVCSFPFPPSQISRCRVGGWEIFKIEWNAPAVRVSSARDVSVNRVEKYTFCF